MNEMGNKIRALRNAVGLTQKQLAEEIGVSEKSVHRYETESREMDKEIIIRLAKYFDVSADYLLGLAPYEKQKREEWLKLDSNNQGRFNDKYSRYLFCKRNAKIDGSSSYYWIYIEEDGTAGGQTMWSGFADEMRMREKRVLREINPEVALSSCIALYGKPMIINSPEDVCVFYLFGGQAFVKTDVCKEHMPDFYKEYIVERE